MALEIKELIVKVRVNEESKKIEQAQIDTEELKNQIIEECMSKLEGRLIWNSER